MHSQPSFELNRARPAVSINESNSKGNTIHTSYLEHIGRNQTISAWGEKTFSLFPFSASIILFSCVASFALLFLPHVLACPKTF